MGFYERRADYRRDCELKRGADEFRASLLKADSY